MKQNNLIFFVHLVDSFFSTMQSYGEMGRKNKKSACNYLLYNSLQVITSTAQVSVQVCTSRLAV